jgi:endonuclease G
MNSWGNSKLRSAVIVLCLVVSPAATRSQSVEQRLSALEHQIRELRAVLDLDTEPPAVLPLEFAGNAHVRWGNPGGTCNVLFKRHYVTCHDSYKRIPEWVAYRLTPRSLQGDAARSDDFRADPELDADQRAVPADYRYSGYDLGHMAPAAAFKRSRSAMSETFLMSNIAPQRPHLNRRLWRKLEGQVRALVETHVSVWVVTGSLFLNTDGTPADSFTAIGNNEVAVPTHFYKVILAESEGLEAFAFVMANSIDPLSGEPADYATSVDSVESIAGLDLFAALPDSTERRIEAAVATRWPVPSR